MELADLRIFLAVASEMSATRAAARLSMTQPGVSQHIAKLENELGKKLFNREGKKLTISDFGRSFLSRAKKLLIDADNLIGIRSEDSCPLGILKLGLTDAATVTVIPPAIAKFRQAYPGIHLRMDVDDSMDIEHGVLRGHYDIGIVTTAHKKHPLLDETILYCDRMDAIVSISHPLSKKKTIELAELANYPLILYSRRSRSRHMIDDILHSIKIFPKDIIEVYTDSAAVKLAEVGIGMAILPEAFITGEVKKGMCARLKIKGNPFTREISLAMKMDADLAEPVIFFRDFLVEWAKKNRRR
jgi:DNA-binding transcriptional LysR family regulator